MQVIDNSNTSSIATHVVVPDINTVNNVMINFLIVVLCYLKKDNIFQFLLIVFLSILI